MLRPVNTQIRQKCLRFLGNKETAPPYKYMYRSAVNRLFFLLYETMPITFTSRKNQTLTVMFPSFS